MATEAHPYVDAPGILVVDDEPPILALLANVLKQQGFQVWTAEDGEEALEVFEENVSSIQMVLMDVRLPEMDGPTILAEMRRHKPKLPAFFMTGNSGSYRLNDLLTCGAKDVFMKPFDIRALAQRLWSQAMMTKAEKVPT